MDVFKFNTLKKSHVKKLGLIVLQSDVTIEDEFRYYLESLPAQTVSLLVNRISFENEVSAETLSQMQAHLCNSMSLFPIDAEFDCLGYGCTSGALHIGDHVIAELAQSTRPCSAVTNPMLAAVNAMTAANVKRLAYLAPYSRAVSQGMVDHFEQLGISVITAGTFDEKYDKTVGRISPASIKQAALCQLEKADVDAVFMSCTNMKCAQIIPEIEEETEVMALSSNQVLMWHMLQSIGLSKEINNKGRLFQC